METRRKKDTQLGFFTWRRWKLFIQTSSKEEWSNGNGESMISNLLKEHKEEIYKMVMKNNTAKSLLKQIDTIFKRIEMMLLKKHFGK